MLSAKAPSWSVAWVLQTFACLEKFKHSAVCMRLISSIPGLALSIYMLQSSDHTAFSLGWCAHRVSGIVSMAKLLSVLSAVLSRCAADKQAHTEAVLGGERTALPGMVSIVKVLSVTSDSTSVRYPVMGAAFTTAPAAVTTSDGCAWTQSLHVSIR